MGNDITCTIQCNYRTAATLHTLETRFVSKPESWGSPLVHGEKYQEEKACDKRCDDDYDDDDHHHHYNNNNNNHHHHIMQPYTRVLELPTDQHRVVPLFSRLITYKEIWFHYISFHLITSTTHSQSL